MSGVEFNPNYRGLDRPGRRRSEINPSRKAMASSGGNREGFGTAVALQFAHQNWYQRNHAEVVKGEFWSGVGLVTINVLFTAAAFAEVWPGEIGVAFKTVSIVVNVVSAAVIVYAIKKGLDDQAWWDERNALNEGRKDARKWIDDLKRPDKEE